MPRHIQRRAFRASFSTPTSSVEYAGTPPRQPAADVAPLGEKTLATLAGMAHCNRGTMRYIAPFAISAVQRGGGLYG